MRIVGLDPGQARIGVAISDEEGRLALPRQTVARESGDRASARALRRELGDLEVAEIVVGLPLRLDGTEGEAARRARRFGDAVAGELERPVSFWDERLTTAEAERSLAAIEVRGRARRQVVDQSAAAILLQSFLDSRRENAWEDVDPDAMPLPEPARRGGRRRGRRWRGGR